MRPKLLTKNLENWLYLNYSTMPNEQIAQELSEKIRAQNKETVAELRRVLPFLSSIHARRDALKRIERLEEFTSLSVDFVKKNAKRLKCPKKSRAYISDINRKRITQKILRDWESKAEYAPQPFAWFRTFQLNNIYYAKFDTVQQLMSFKSSLCNFNRSEGPERGMYLMSDYYKENLIARIDVCPFR
ncbi:MAG: hypothetical protein J6Y99_07510 [Bacteroidales bacterium]|nr:hypothetical protein [Bacteroidales bacterium]